MTNNDHPLGHGADVNRDINCLACHRDINGRYVIVGTDHYCTRCGAQLVRIGIGRYVNAPRKAEVAA